MTRILPHSESSPNDPSFVCDLLLDFGIAFGAGLNWGFYLLWASGSLKITILPTFITKSIVAVVQAARLEHNTYCQHVAGHISLQGFKNPKQKQPDADSRFPQSCKFTRLKCGVGLSALSAEICHINQQNKSKHHEVLSCWLHKWVSHLDKQQTQVALVAMRDCHPSWKRSA
eukprot:460853-Amphidinium_carterae.1